MVKRSEFILHGSQKDLAEVFIDSPCQDPQEFFAKVNEMRSGADIALISPDYKIIRAMEIAQIKEQSKTFKPSLQKLVNMGFDLDEIRYSKNMEEMLQKYMLRNPNLKLEDTEDVFAETYHEALDYIDRHNRLMLLKLETATPAQLKKYAKKREQDYQLLYSCGFSDQEIAEHKTLIRNLENDPKTIKKAYRLLQATGAVPPTKVVDTSTESGLESAKQAIKDSRDKIKLISKSAFWCVACCGCLALHTVSALNGKKIKKNVFSRYVRKHPGKVAKEYKRMRAKEKATGLRLAREEQKRENEYLRFRVAKDYHQISIQKVFSKAE